MRRGYRQWVSAFVGDGSLLAMCCRPERNRQGATHTNSLRLKNAKATRCVEIQNLTSTTRPLRKVAFRLARSTSTSWCSRKERSSGKTALYTASLTTKNERPWYGSESIIARSRGVVTSSSKSGDRG